ncbi:MAG TPA: PaaI family thioesterase [Pseudomonadales bacterium]|nr:PaaI family thioesterase [Pseudomonadales bacterium]
MKLLRDLRAEGKGRDMSALLEHIPYARFLGISVDRKGNELTMVMPFSPHLVGNTSLPALHGGAIGAFLEFTAVIQLLYDADNDSLPKTVDFSIDYLRSGRPEETYGRAIITKHGRRVANVRVEAWQEERDRPIATGHGHFLLTPSDGEG